MKEVASAVATILEDADEDADAADGVKGGCSSEKMGASSIADAARCVELLK